MIRALLIVVLLFLCVDWVTAQPCKTDAPCIATKDSLKHAIAQKPWEQMVDLNKTIPRLVTDLRYATTNNFTHTVLYHHPIACMHKDPADALKKVQAELSKRGLGLKIYDAYRPLSVTCKIWRLSPDRHYTANPRKGSNHNRAVAVDLTIIDLRTGKELDMGTGFDSFTDSAHHSFTNLPAPVLANRRLLESIMWKFGFSTVPEEWWHYQWRGRSKYEVIDLDFDDIKELL